MIRLSYNTILILYVVLLFDNLQPIKAVVNWLSALDSAKISI